MNHESYIGCAVTVILREGSYHGTIHRFDSEDKRITLTDVSNPVDGNKYPGIRHFYAAEILDMVMDDDYDESLIDNPPSAVIQTDEAPAYEDAFPVTSEAHDSSSKTNVPDYPPAISCDRYTIIEEFNGQFEEVMTLIQEQLIIGFHIVSVGAGRHGKICWITISVDKHVYLFDFLVLGKSLFKKGLHDVLESKKITKIIHDCRFISDLLYHKYSVNLSNVFDTQVASTFVHHTWYGTGHKNVWPKFVQPLSVCLFGHLKLTTEEIAGLKACEGRSEIEKELWPKRPLSIPLAETLVCSVKYLQELQLLLIEKMMVEYRAGVHIYLGSVRNLPDSEVSWHANKSELLPKPFYQINKFTQIVKDGFKNREKESPSEFTPSENNLERTKTIQKKAQTNKNAKSVLSPVDNSQNTESNKSISNTREKSIVKEKLKKSKIPNDEIITSSSITLTDENKCDIESNCANEEEDILIQAARKMIASDIPSDLMDLLKMPVKDPPVSDFNLKTLNNLEISAQNNSTNSSNQTGVEWSRYRKDNFDSNKLSLVPAGSSMTLIKKKKSNQSPSIQNGNYQSLSQKRQPKLYKQQNNENQNPVHTRCSLDESQQNSHPDNQITDTFFEIPDSDSHTWDNNVLGQIQTYSSYRQPYQYTASNSYWNNDSKNCINSPLHTLTGPKTLVSNSIKDTHSTSDEELPLHTGPKYRVSNSIKDTHSTSDEELPLHTGPKSRVSNSIKDTHSTSDEELPLHTGPKSQVLSSIKDTHSTKISSQELLLHTEKSNSSKVQTVSGIAKENGANRNYWANGSGIVGNGSMTHIERLMAIWKNNCK